MKRHVRKILRSVGFWRAPVAPAAVSPLLRHVNAAHLLPPRRLVRLGTDYGGWDLPDDLPLSSDSICYLAGAGEDISFDVALVQRYHCSVRIVDPTPRAIQHFADLQRATAAGEACAINHSSDAFYEVSPEDLQRMTFLPVGLSDADTVQKFYFPQDPAHVSCSAVNLQKTNDYFTAQCHRLPTLMARQGDARVDLLKLNIEGAEYAVLSDILSHNLLPPILLVVFDEGHTPMDERAGERIADHIERLTRTGMRCVAVHGCCATFMRT